MGLDSFCRHGVNIRQPTPDPHPHLTPILPVLEGRGPWGCPGLVHWEEVQQQGWAQVRPLKILIGLLLYLLGLLPLLSAHQPTRPP